MIKIIRSSRNPILSPMADHPWEAEATFNGSILKENKLYHLFYRAVSKSQNSSSLNFPLSVIGKATSADGENFYERKLFLKPEMIWEKYGCEDPRITKLEQEYFIFYTALSFYPPDSSTIKVALAVSSNLEDIKEKHLITPFNAKAMALFSEKINGQYVAILTVNTDLPPSKICLAFFNKKEDIWSVEYWHDWYQYLPYHSLNLQRLNTDHLEVGSPPLKTEAGWLVFYSHIQNYQSPVNRIFGIEAILLDLQNPKKILGRTQMPLLLPEEVYELKGTVPKVVFPSGAVLEGKEILLYYGAADTYCCLAKIESESLLKELKEKKVFLPKLFKSPNNPILEPVAEHPWENKAVFNPGALKINDKIYLIYRAMSTDNTSTLGCAITQDGFNIDQRLEEPIYLPRHPWELKKKNNANSGCEDPRLTLLNNTIFMCYTAFNGLDHPRVAFTSISTDDFINYRWHWSPPKIISQLGIENKNACLFPEKINNQYLIFHRAGGKDIYFDFFDDLEFKTDQTLSSERRLEFEKKKWCDKKCGIAAPPIKTPKGWLTLIHGVSTIDNQYRVGYLILDLKNPTKVIYVSDYPILEPTEPFETHGFYNNVVFPCGAIIKDQKLLVYYGGGDQAVGVASINLNNLLP